MKFRKMLAMVLAVAMIASLVPLVGTTAKAAGGPTMDHVDDNPVWYGAGADKYKAGGGIAIDIVETSTGPYVVDDEIMFTVTFTNNTGSDITRADGTNLKIHLYNTAENLVEKNIKPDVEFASTGNLQYKFTAHSESPAGHVTTFDSMSSRELKYKDPVFKNGASITVSLYYKVKATDVTAGKHLKNFIMIYLGSTDAAHAVGRYVQSAFTEVVSKDDDVGTLTVTNTVESSDPDHMNKYFDYIVTLTDKNVNDTLGGVTFTNGVGKFSLKTGEQKTIDHLVAGTGYTVEESNYDGFTVTNTVDSNEFGDVETVNGYTAKGTVDTGSAATVAFTNREKVVAPTKPTPALTYHLNPPDGTADTTWVDSTPTSSNEKTATFALKGFENKTDGPFGSISTQPHLINGKYEAGGKTWYFAGWETSKAAADAAKTYDQVEYAINNLDDNVRGYTDKGRPSHTITVSDTALGNNNLYAVWFEKPGMVGYTMTHTGAKFPSMTMGGMILGDNGITNTDTPEKAGNSSLTHAQKYVVWNDGGHYYDKSARTGDPFTVTTATPTNPDGYNFLGWFVKNANKASSTAAGFDGFPDPNKSFIAMPGSTVYYGAVETIYSLDALWGKLTGGASVVAPYDGGEHTVNVTGANAITAEFPASSLDPDKVPLADTAYNAFFANDTLEATASNAGTRTNSYIHYYVTVEKDGEQVGDEVELKNETGHYLPQQREPGIYTYTISARLQIDDPSNGNNTASVSAVTLDVGAVSLQLVILPEIEVEITKAINGRDFVSGDSFEFNVTVTDVAGVDVTGSPITITNDSLDHKGTVKIGFPVGSDGKPQVAPGTYTVTVSEQGTAETFAAKGMIKAPDVTFTFDIAVDEDTGAVTVSNIKGKDIVDQLISVTEDNITVPVTMRNEYKTGSLTVTNTVLPVGTEPGTPFTFTVNFTGDTSLDFSSVRSDNSTGSNTVTVDPSGNSATVSIASTGTVEITGIPVGASYTVTKGSIPANFTSSLDTGSVTGTIAMDNLDQTVEIENYYVTPGSLTIHKTVTNDKFMTQADKAAAAEGFKIHVKLENTGITGGSITVTGADATNITSATDTYEFDVTLKDGESAVITGIPDSTTYTVEEKDVDSAKYTTSYSGASGTSATGSVTSGRSASVVITNKYNPVTTGLLVIEKKIEGNSLTKPGNTTEFDVQITLSDYNGIQLTGVNTFGGTTFTNGVATVKVSVNAKKTITGLPQGLQYKVEEITSDGASVSYGSQTGTIGTDETTVTVTNTYTVSTYNLTIKNIVVGSGSAKHTFTITMDDNFTNFQYQKNSGTLDSSTSNEVTGIELGDGETITILNVPVGATYSVNETETEDASYTSFSIDASPMPRTMARAATNNTETGNRILNNNTTVTYINAYTGTLKLQVKLDGEGDWPNKDKSATFEFEIDTGDPTFNGTVNTLDFVNGVATVTLTVGTGAESASKSWVMPAATYIVTETEHNGAKTVAYDINGASNNNATVTSPGTTTVIVTNTYEKSIVPPTPGPGDGGGGGGGVPTPGPGGNETDPDDGGDGPGDVIDRAEHFGYIIGVAPGQVRPDQNITRAEIATIIFRLLTDEAREANWSENSGFADVKSGDWYNHAVAVLYNLGIIKGKEDGLFHPNDMITRAELATMLARFYDEPQNTVLTNRFIDVEPDKWFTDYVLRADYYGLMQGDGNRFKPEDLLTRAEAMTAFNRLLGRKPHKDHLCEGMITWIDNSDKSKWYYAAVQEATNSHECGDDVTVDGVTYETWLKITPMRDWAALEY